MSLAGMFDHRVRVWRPVETKGAHREAVRTHTAVTAEPEDVNATVARPRMPMQDPGAGLAPVGQRVVYMEADTDVQALDVLQLLEGPDAPALLEVAELPTRPRGHHVELRCNAWHGTLPEES